MCSIFLQERLSDRWFDCYRGHKQRFNAHTLTTTTLLHDNIQNKDTIDCTFRTFSQSVFFWQRSFEPHRDKTNKMACAPSEDSDQTGRMPSLVWVFAVRMKKAWVLSYPLSAQRRLWSDGADAQADLSLRWTQSFCWFCHEAAQFYLKH